MKKKQIIAAGLATVLSFSLLAGCQKAEVKTEDSKGADKAATETTETTDSLRTEYPLTMDIYDADGNKVAMTYDEAPQKVISTQLSMTELLIELGLEDKIIGVVKNDNAIKGENADKIAEMNNLGDKKSVSKEVILSEEPDLILGKGPLMFADTAIGTVQSYQDAGINVYTQLASANIDQSLENIIQDVKNIGVIFDVQEEAEAYTKELQDKLAQVEKEVSGEKGEKKTVLLMCGYTDGIFSAFSSKLHTSMLNTVNAENVLEQGAGDLSSENLVAMNPDYIIYIKADRFAATDETALDDMYANEAIQSVSAIANHKILEMDYDDVMDYGARDITAVESLYTFMYEE
jgi:iron complex transport system substrate-binding protein